MPRNNWIVLFYFLLDYCAENRKLCVTWIIRYMLQFCSFIQIFSQLRTPFILTFERQSECTMSTPITIQVCTLRLLRLDYLWPPVECLKKKTMDCLGRRINY
ncbi:hypothetical protein ACP275_02G088100 [Erythranthe tilingii]